MTTSTVSVTEADVLDRVDQLLDELDPVETPPGEFLGRQYDLGLGWVHFPEGYGGRRVVERGCTMKARDVAR